jgi:hypothetical protein
MEPVRPAPAPAIPDRLVPGLSRRRFVRAGAVAVGLAFTLTSVVLTQHAAAGPTPLAVEKAEPTSLPTATPPPLVIGLRLVAGDHHVIVMWTKPVSSTLTRVQIFRAKGAAKTSASDLVGSQSAQSATSGSYTDERGIQPSTAYFYTVSGNDGSSSGEPQPVTTEQPGTRPAKIEGFTARPASSSDVNLQWTNSSSEDVTGVVIRRLKGSEPPKTVTEGDGVGQPTLAPVSGKTGQLIDPGRDPGTQYSYAVFAVDVDRDVSNGASAGAKTLLSNALPERVLNLTRTRASASSIKLSWKDPRGNADFVNVAIVRALGDKPPSKITPENEVAVVLRGEQTYTVRGLRSSKKPYYFAVFALDRAERPGPGYVTAPVSLTAPSSHRVALLALFVLAVFLGAGILGRSRLVALIAAAPTQPNIPSANRNDILTGAPRVARRPAAPSVGGVRYSKQIPVVLPVEVVLDASVGAAMAYGTAGRFEVRAACVRGLDHASSGDAGDDVALIVHRPDVLFAVVSDGMGSQAGSRFIARAVIDGFTKAFADPGKGPQQAIQSGVANAGRAAAELAKAQGSGAATVIAAALVPHAGGTTVYAACVGDSGLFARSDQTVEELLGDEDDGAGTRGMPLHVEAIYAAFEVPLANAVILASDGFHTALMDPAGELSSHLTQLWAKAPRPVDFLDTISFEGDYYYDDRSVVAVWRTRES